MFLDAHLTHAELATARARTDRFVSPYPTPDRDPSETLTHALATAIDRMLANPILLADAQATAHRLGAGLTWDTVAARYADMLVQAAQPRHRCGTRVRYRHPAARRRQRPAGDAQETGRTRRGAAAGGWRRAGQGLR